MGYSKIFVGILVLGLVLMGSVSAKPPPYDPDPEVNACRQNCYSACMAGKMVKPTTRQPYPQSECESFCTPC